MYRSHFETLQISIARKIDLSLVISRNMKTEYEKKRKKKITLSQCSVSALIDNPRFNRHFPLPFFFPPSLYYIETSGGHDHEYVIQTERSRVSSRSTDFILLSSPSFGSLIFSIEREVTRKAKIGSDEASMKTIQAERRFHSKVNFRLRSAKTDRNRSSKRAQPSFSNLQRTKRERERERNVRLTRKLMNFQRRFVKLLSTSSQ